MKHGTHCKFCHIPITIEVSDDYIGDPLKIIGFAACNQCAQLRQDRRDLEESLQKLCLVFHRSNQATKEQTLETVRAGLSTMTRKYSKVVADWCKIPLHFEPEVVDKLLAQPDHVLIILKSLWPHEVKS